LKPQKRPLIETPKKSSKTNIPSMNSISQKISDKDVYKGIINYQSKPEKAPNPKN
jgi:hypothetical protein